MRRRFTGCGRPLRFYGLVFFRLLACGYTTVSITFEFPYVFIDIITYQ